MKDQVWVVRAVARALLHGLWRGRRTKPPARPRRSLDDISRLPSWGWTVPPRPQQLSRLRTETFDLLVIGGGATGAGTALEAAARGLKVALVERGDFSSGTSSKSTKLIHGGVRYLEKAIMKLDRVEYELVFEGLDERRRFMAMAPHLTSELRLLTPCYRWWELPYYAAGLFLYDWIAGQDTMQATRVLGRDAALEQVPVLQGENLKGGVSYSDGQFDDARMNVGL
ncbi:MAG TPA: FAD-dependent oxidoreductase, partial [Candidatus Xenobia bacterium]